MNPPQSSEMERRELSWVIQVGPRWNHKCSCKREAVGDLTQMENRRQHGDQGTARAEAGVRRLSAIRRTDISFNDTVPARISAQ